MTPKDVPRTGQVSRAGVMSLGGTALTALGGLTMGHEGLLAGSAASSALVVAPYVAAKMMAEPEGAALMAKLAEGNLPAKAMQQASVQ